jgi:hypothetical protein
VASLALLDLYYRIVKSARLSGEEVSQKSRFSVRLGIGHFFDIYLHRNHKENSFAESAADY